MGLAFIIRIQLAFSNARINQPAYDLGNLRVGLDAQQWSATVDVTKITDEVAEGFFNNRWGTPQRVTVNRPRTIVLNLRWKF
jgi:outer membrane receptor protein involved in Fe transport